MTAPLLADTGLLVAFLHADDQYHEWAVSQFKSHPLPFLTCDAVLTEATYVLAREGMPREHVLDLVATGTVVVAFNPNAEAEAVAVLLARYSDVPMDYADACLVRMAELYPEASVLTVDSDFHVYRKNRRSAIPVITP